MNDNHHPVHIRVAFGGGAGAVLLPGGHKGDGQDKKRALLDDYGLTYQDGVPWRPEPIRSVVHFEVVQRFLEGVQP